jgi:hypothetical protein
MMLLLGIFIGVVTSIVGNLLTPFVRPIWGRFAAIQARGYRARIEQQIKVLQVELDQLDRFNASDRDLFLYLFRWLLSIIAVFVAALTCGFLGVTSVQPGLSLAALILLVLAAVMALVVVSWCGYLTTHRTAERTSQLHDQIAKLKAKVQKP